MKLTHGMVLAAGLGTRMRPLTLEMPKPLIQVAGKALIDWNLEFLAAGGITQVVVNTSYLADQLEAHLAGRAALSREGSPPLETGGGVKKALPLLGEGVFLTMNSDAILPGPNPIATLRDAWREGIDFLLLLVPKANAIGWQGNGDFVVEGAQIRRPREGEEAPYIFSGVELMHPRAFESSPDGAFSLSALWKQSDFRRVGYVVHDVPWLNVGDLAGLKTAQAYFATRP